VPINAHIPIGPERRANLAIVNTVVVLGKNFERNMVMISNGPGSFISLREMNCAAVLILASEANFLASSEIGARGIDLVVCACELVVGGVETLGNIIAGITRFDGIKRSVAPWLVQCLQVRARRLVGETGELASRDEESNKFGSIRNSHIC